MSQATIYNSETNEPMVIETSTKNELVNRELVWHDGKNFLFGDCEAFQGAVKELEPWYEAEDCEECSAQDEEANIEYERNMTWENGCYTCDGCGRPQ